MDRFVRPVRERKAGRERGAVARVRLGAYPRQNRERAAPQTNLGSAGRLIFPELPCELTVDGAATDALRDDLVAGRRSKPRAEALDLRHRLREGFDFTAGADDPGSVP